MPAIKYPDEAAASHCAAVRLAVRSVVRPVEPQMRQPVAQASAGATQDTVRSSPQGVPLLGSRKLFVPVQSALQPATFG